MALVISGTELFPSSSVNGLVCLRKVELVQQRQPHRRLKVEQQRVGVRASSELLEPVTSAATTDLTWQITAGAIDVTSFSRFVAGTTTFNEYGAYDYVRNKLSGLEVAFYH
ncbi:hypothetical protein AXG93_2145s1880 [Marchantia polymorpha subsp. ruderalis]|uniref:Uncharacterized protein n=1 Tax=Marchantia polymorpha subsp. ruderalis TaxID=1480154 RepID=A0A176VYJ9_MARPO|nr:hypothetical protein AXG93_2145s1880 [Marchantia polymorpha subsp. ruderalis]